MKPPFPYYGGKTRIADQIVNLLPPHRHYVEPFAGALSVLLAKPPAPLETANDLNEDLITFFRTLRDQPEELTRLCALTPHSRHEYELAQDRPPNLTDLERARRTFVHLSQGRSASLRKTGWAHFVNPSTMSNGGNRSTYIRNMVARFAEIADRLLSVSLECRPATTIIEQYGAHPGVLLYVDPPYLHTTRTSQGYEHEMGRADQHHTLLEQLTTVNAAVVLSGYASRLYDTTLKGWERTELHGRSQRNQPRVEVVWSNRPLEQHLFTPEEATAR